MQRKYFFVMISAKHCVLTLVKEHSLQKESYDQKHSLVDLSVL